MINVVSRCYDIGVCVMKCVLKLAGSRIYALKGELCEDYTVSVM